MRMTYQGISINGPAMHRDNGQFIKDPQQHHKYTHRFKNIRVCFDPFFQCSAAHKIKCCSQQQYPCSSSTCDEHFYCTLCLLFIFNVTYKYDGDDTQGFKSDHKAQYCIALQQCYGCRSDKECLGDRCIIFFMQDKCQKYYLQDQGKQCCRFRTCKPAQADRSTAEKHT